MFLPKLYIKIILLPKTNNRIKGYPSSFGELFQFILLWILVTPHPCYNKRVSTPGKADRYFKSSANPFKRLHDWKPIWKYNCAPPFTDLPPPYFKDQFFLVFHIIVAWNENTKDLCIPLWVYCLYESIYRWAKHFTWMDVCTKEATSKVKWLPYCVLRI